MSPSDFLSTSSETFPRFIFFWSLTKSFGSNTCSFSQITAEIDLKFARTLLNFLTAPFSIFVCSFLGRFGGLTFKIWRFLGFSRGPPALFLTNADFFDLISIGFLALAALILLDLSLLMLLYLCFCNSKCEKEAGKKGSELKDENWIGCESCENYYHQDCLVNHPSLKNMEKQSRIDLVQK